MAFFKTFRVFKLLTYRTFVYIVIWRIFVINLVKTEQNNYKVINRNATLSKFLYLVEGDIIRNF